MFEVRMACKPANLKLPGAFWSKHHTFPKAREVADRLAWDNPEKVVVVAEVTDYQGADRD